jgi:hypothetical protein
MKSRTPKKKAAKRPSRSSLHKSKGRVSHAPADPRLAALTFFDPAAPWGLNAVTQRPWGPPEPFYPYACAMCHLTITGPGWQQHGSECEFTV